MIDKSTEIVNSIGPRIEEIIMIAKFAQAARNDNLHEDPDWDSMLATAFTRISVAAAEINMLRSGELQPDC